MFFNIGQLELEKYLFVLEVRSVDGNESLRFVRAEDTLDARQAHKQLNPLDVIHRVRTSTDQGKPQQYKVLTHNFPCERCPFGNSKCKYWSAMVPKLENSYVYASNANDIEELVEKTKCPGLNYRIVSTIKTDRRR